MGYQTMHTLTVYDDSVVIDGEDHKEEINEMVGDDLWDEPIKWYESDFDMRAYSKRYPNLLFEIYADGEETGDMCYYYYKNGLCQECPAEIRFPPFDEQKLK